MAVEKMNNENNDILISVIVPVYNSEMYLSKCIESILNQEYTNFELILVDDGSTDKSGSICDSYARKDERIKVIHKKNGGLVSARKAGANCATGEYIIPADSDDWIDRDYLRNFVQIEKIREYDCVWTMGFYWEYENSTQLNEKVDLTQEEYYDYAFALDEDNPTTFYQSMCLKLIKTDLYIKVQESMDDRISHQEDITFTTRLESLDPQVYFIVNSGYHYRRHDSSMVSSNKGVIEGSDEILLLDTLSYLNQSNGKNVEKLMKNAKLAYARTKLFHDFKGMQTDSEIIFPFTRIEKGDCVAVFCAGPIGQQLITNIKERNFCNVVCWLDNNKAGTLVNGEVIYGVDSISQYVFDKVVIATIHVESISRIRGDLLKQGVDESKIVCMDMGLLLNYAEKRMKEL